MALKLFCFCSTLSCVRGNDGVDGSGGSDDNLVVVLLTIMKCSD